MDVSLFAHTLRYAYANHQALLVRSLPSLQVRDRPGHAPAWHAMADMHLASGEVADALDAIRKASDACRDSPEVFFSLGNVLFAAHEQSDRAATAAADNAAQMATEEAEAVRRAGKKARARARRDARGAAKAAKAAARAEARRAAKARKGFFAQDDEKKSGLGSASEDSDDLSEDMSSLSGGSGDDGEGSGSDVRLFFL